MLWQVGYPGLWVESNAKTSVLAKAEFIQTFGVPPKTCTHLCMFRGNRVPYEQAIQCQSLFPESTIQEI